MDNVPEQLGLNATNDSSPDGEPAPLESTEISMSGAVEAPAPIRAQAVKFCTACGADLLPNWITCQACEARRIRAAAAGQAVADVTSQQRTVVSAVALYASLLLVSIVSILVATVSGRDSDLGGLEASMIAMTIITVIWSIVSWRATLPPLARVGPPKWLAMSVPMAICTYVFASLVLGGMSHLIGIKTERYLDIFTSAGSGLGLATLLVCVQPAIFEELAFRGIIYNSLMKVTGSGAETVFASAAMFAILHLSIPSFPHLLIMGAALGFLRLKSGSLYPGMLLHFSHNFLCIYQEQTGGWNLW